MKDGHQVLRVDAFDAPLVLRPAGQTKHLKPAQQFNFIYVNIEEKFTLLAVARTMFNFWR